MNRNSGSRVLPVSRCRLSALVPAIGLVVACAVTAGPVVAQVNIEQHRSQDDGSSLAVDASVSLRAGNSDLYDLAGGAQFSHRSGSRFVLLLARIRYGENDGTPYAGAAFAHVRYTHWFTRRVAVEAYGQVERDKFTLLQLRTLLGAGIRISATDTKSFTSYLGSSVMLELENLDGALVEMHPANSEVIRSSNYLSLRWTINERASLSTTVYAQPRVDEPADIRLLQDAAIEVEITGAIALRLALRQRFDSTPPDDIARHDIFIENGIRIRL